jgi:SNF2 family DNA or RNA helicase
MLRRSKEVVLSELPPKIEQTLYCELSEVQQKMYEDTLASLKKHVWEEVQTKGFARSQITILAALMKLRQICNHSGMLPSDIAREEEASGKFDVFFSLLSDTLRDGRKVLVFSSFVKTLKLLEAELQKRGISYSYMDGQTKQRSTVINEFTDDPSKQVFLLSMKVGGVGLNLTASDMVVLFDPWWNPMVEMQAMDRAHRIGQLKTVHVYSLITKNTLEERMLSLKEKKKALFKSTVGDAETFVRSLTWEDIEDLFRFETPAEQ